MRRDIHARVWLWARSLKLLSVQGSLYFPPPSCLPPGTADSSARSITSDWVACPVFPWNGMRSMLLGARRCCCCMPWPIRWAWNSRGKNCPSFLGVWRVPDIICISSPSLLCCGRSPCSQHTEFSVCGDSASNFPPYDRALSTHPAVLELHDQSCGPQPIVCRPLVVPQAVFSFCFFQPKQNLHVPMKDPQTII